MTRENQQLQQLLLADFTGGVNTSVAPEFLQDNEFQMIKNMEFKQNRLVTRAGLSDVKIDFQTDDVEHGDSYFMTGAVWLEKAKEFVVVLRNRRVYRLSSTFTKTYLGLTTGTEKPTFCLFDGRVFIASGGKLQYTSIDDEGYDGLVTIQTSHDCNNVFERFGRIVTTMTGDDYMYYSAVGNPYDDDGWEDDTNDDSSSKYIEIGYKDSGDIIKAVPMAGDIMVFKNNGRVYSVSGEYPNWNVQMVAENTDVLNKEAICQMGSDIAFLTNNGLKTLQTTATYGNFTANEIARKVNSDIKRLVRDALAAEHPSKIDPQPAVYHLVRKRQLIIVPDITIAPYYQQCICYQYDIGAATFFEFPYRITDVIETNDKVYFFSYFRIFEWDESYEKDKDITIKQEIISKQYETTGRYYTRRVDFGIKGKAGEKVYFEWANKRITYEIDELRRVKQMFSVCRQSPMKIQTQAKISLEYIKMYLFEGV